MRRRRTAKIGKLPAHEVLCIPSGCHKGAGKWHMHMFAELHSKITAAQTFGWTSAPYFHGYPASASAVASAHTPAWGATAAWLLAIPITTDFCSRLSPVLGQVNGEAAALLGLAGHLDAAPGQLHDPPDDGKPQALLFPAGISLVVLFKAGSGWSAPPDGRTPPG